MQIEEKNGNFKLKKCKGRKDEGFKGRRGQAEGAKLTTSKDLNSKILQGENHNPRPAPTPLSNLSSPSII
jgi:hypothetical protein